MKNKFWIFLASITILALGVIIAINVFDKKNNYLEDINYTQLLDKINKKESFVFLVYQTGCPACERFEPNLKDALNSIEYRGYALNITNMSEEEWHKFDEVFNVNATPTMVFIKDGKETKVDDRLIGVYEKDEVIKKLKDMKYID